MRRHILILITLLSVLTVHDLSASEPGQCPVTEWHGNMLGDPFPEENSWYGSEAFAVVLPTDATWGVTGDIAAIAVKSVWWTPHFRPGMESNLSVEIENLFDPTKIARISEPTNAGIIDEDNWYMLVGIDFPFEGCWKVTGRYLGQELSFVVRTVGAENSSQDAT